MQLGLRLEYEDPGACLIFSERQMKEMLKIDCTEFIKASGTEASSALAL